MSYVTDWNVVLTVVPGLRHVSEVLGAVARFGRFAPTSFKDVCVGRVADVPALLEAIGQARAQQKEWALAVGHVVPVEISFVFAPEQLADEVKRQGQRLWERLPEGSVCVRVKRRGLAGQVHSQQVEQTVADAIMTMAETAGKRLTVSLSDPDCTIVIETLDTVAGIGLITRAQRERYPFMQVR
jgi:tRNA(Ser,Leu) C12 N-acetylase TAN1